MIFNETAVAGAYTIDLERFEDERGFFARAWGALDFGAQGLASRLAHISLSVNRHAGTLRGMHYQSMPHAEVKIVRCTRGAIYDVAVDLRRESPTYLKWTGVELTPANGRMLYIPEGCAHGFLTLADESEMLYLISAEYSPAHARGVRWDDPSFGIRWPGEVRVINDRDRGYPDYQP
jgi:dTDP-4-dehydrorhamnose 3,5-epimerase